MAAPHALRAAQIVKNTDGNNPKDINGQAFSLVARSDFIYLGANRAELRKGRTR
jgi:hypothetical protein